MSEDKKRAAMAEIISAKCFACGHVIKVPAALAGKKAKCPQCAQVIHIPSQANPAGEFVSDDMLPEVARDEDIVDGEIVEEADEVVEGEPVEETPSSGRLRSMTPRRGTPPAGRGGRKGTGVHQKPPAHGGYAPPRKSSAAPIVIGVIVAVVALGVVLAVALSGSAGGRKAQAGEKAAPPPPPPVTDADNALRQRCQEFLSVFSRGNVIDIVRFYSVDPNEDQAKIRKGIASLMEQGAYDNPVIKSASAGSGTVTLQTAKGDKTITWKLVEGTWYIADRP